MQCFEYRTFAHDVVCPLKQRTGGFFAQDELLCSVGALQMIRRVALASGERANDDGAGIGQQPWNGSADCRGRHDVVAVCWNCSDGSGNRGEARDGY